MLDFMSKLLQCYELHSILSVCVQTCSLRLALRWHVPPSSMPSAMHAH